MIGPHFTARPDPILSHFSSFLHLDPVSLSFAVLLFPAIFFAAGRKRSIGRGWIALCAGFVAILSTSSVAVATAMGLLMTQEPVRCPLWWSVPALLLWVLFPYSPAIFLPLLPVLFWAELKDARSIAGQVQVQEHSRSGMLVAVGCLWHQPSPAPLMIALGVGGLAVARPLLGLVRAEISAGICRFRPLLLICVVTAAEKEGLGATAEAGALALFLDLAVFTVLPALARRAPEIGFLRFPLPPLPGFIVLWLGIHAALGLVGGAQGWSVTGIGLALLMTGLSLLDIVAIGEIRQVPEKSPGHRLVILSAGALLFPAAVLLLFAPAIHQMGGSWIWSVASLNGGDGAHLRLAWIGLVMFAIWLVLTRPWSGQGGGAFARSNEHETFLVPGAHFFGWQPVGPYSYFPVLPWGMRRIMASVRSVWRQVRRLSFLRVPDMQGLGVVLWLILLACVLAAVGLSQ